MVLRERQNSFLAQLSARELAALQSHLVPLPLGIGDTLHTGAAAAGKVVFPESGVVALGIRGQDGIGPGILGGVME
jgi:hypothetical protein